MYIYVLNKHAYTVTSVSLTPWSRVLLEKRTGSQPVKFLVLYGTHLEKCARNMGLVINQEKTVYIYSGKDTTLHQDLAVGNCIFKRVDDFKYLGTMVNKMNTKSLEVNARLAMANRTYYGL
jgi:hypothetical protein